MRNTTPLLRLLLLLSILLVVSFTTGTNAERHQRKTFNCNAVFIDERYNAFKKFHDFQLTSSALYISSNRGYQTMIWDEVSEMLKYWSRLSPERLEAWHDATQRQAFSYVDLCCDDNPHQLSRQCLPSSIDSSNIWTVIPYTQTLYLDDKLKFGQAAKEAGLEGPDNLIPRTFGTKNEALEELLVESNAHNTFRDIFFVKDRFGTKGMGITIHPLVELPNVQVPETSIIQEGLTDDIALYDGTHKMTGRLYMVVANGSLYIHHKGTVKVQHSSFVPASTNPDTQMSHDGYADPYNLDLLHYGGTNESSIPEFHQPFVHKMYGDDNTLWGPSFDKSRVVNSEKWFYHFQDMAQRSAPQFLRPIIEYTQFVDTKSFSVLGVDVIPMKDGSLRMIEINHYPNLYRFDIVSDVILTLMGMSSLDENLATSRLIKVWEVPTILEQEQQPPLVAVQQQQQCTVVGGDDDIIINGTLKSSASMRAGRIIERDGRIHNGPTSNNDFLSRVVSQ